MGLKIFNAIKKFITIPNRGSVVFTDSQYTLGSPLLIPDTGFIDVGNNKNIILVNSDDTDISNWIDNTGKITPKGDLNDDYQLRINFTAVPPNNNTSLYFRIDIGTGSPIIITRSAIRFTRDSGVPTRYSITVPYYTGSTFFANGGKIQFGGSVQIPTYDYSFYIKRLL